MHKGLLSQRHYRKFVTERDAILERVNQNAQVDLSRILFSALQSIEHLASSLALKASTGTYHNLSQHFEQGTLEIFTQTFPLLKKRVEQLRKATFMLAYASEQYAIGKATGLTKEPTPQEFKARLEKAVKAPSLLGQSIDKRIWLCVMKLRGRILSGFQNAVIADLPPHEIVNRVTMQFPKIVQYKRPPKALTRPLREASIKHNPDTDELEQDEDSQDYIDGDDWSFAADAYKDTLISPNRFDNSGPSYDDDTGVMKYNWELEQETTEDFVKQVRDGQNEGASDRGIKDFVWVAILDKSTDECCEVRNGKLTSEIEAGLASGSIDADECDAVTPPAHFNCRCMIDPVASSEPIEGPDWASAQEWLDS
jgi:hypothetical protein